MKGLMGGVEGDLHAGGSAVGSCTHAHTHTRTHTLTHTHTHTHRQRVTYERCKWVHCEAGPHHNQQIGLGEVCLHLLEKPRRQALSKENYVRLDKTLCIARLVSRASKQLD